MFPFGFLCWSHITGREERIRAIHFGKQVGNGFQCMMRATDSVENVKGKNVTSGRSNVLASDVERLLQMGGEGRFHAEILAIHPRVDDQADVVHVNSTLLAEIYGQTLEGFHQRFFLDVLGPECNDAYQSSTP